MKNPFRLLLPAFVFIAVLLSAVQIFAGSPAAPAPTSAVCSGPCDSDDDCIAPHVVCVCAENRGRCEVW